MNKKSAKIKLVKNIGEKLIIVKQKRAIQKKEKHFSKLVFEIILVLILMASFCINYKCFNPIDELSAKYEPFPQIATNIMMVVFPFILTIISLALSLPKELIYGLEKTEFRKLKGAGKYNFLTMVLISLILILFFGVAYLLKFSLVMMIIVVISIVYMIIFLIQEIPLLMHSESRIERVIKTYIHDNIDVIDARETKNPNTLVHYLIFKKGIVYTYRLIEDKSNSAKNLKYINFLLEVQNHYFWRYRENFSSKIISNSLEFENLKIIDVIDKSFENINILLNYDKELNLNNIFVETEYVHQITRLFFSLKDVLENLELKNKYEEKLGTVISDIFMSLSLSKNKDDERIVSYYKLLNKMVISTAESYDLWFVELIRDYGCVTTRVFEAPLQYLLFLSIYFHYLINAESSVPSEFKEKLKLFINSTNDTTTIYGNTWAQVLERKLRDIEIEKAKQLLIDLLKLYDNGGDELSWWYSNKSQISSATSIEKLFNKKMIVNWWISFVISNDNIFNQQFKGENSIIPDLKGENTAILVNEIWENWLDDDKVLTSDIFGFYDLFGWESYTQQSGRNTNTMAQLRDFSKKIKTSELLEKYPSEPRTSDALQEYETLLKEGFLSAVKSLEILDQTIDLSKEKTVYFPFTLQTIHSKEFIESYIKRIPDSLSNLVRNYIYQEENFNKFLHKKEVEELNEETLKFIIDFNADFKTSDLYKRNANKGELALIDIINKINNLQNNYLPRNMFLKRNAIRINVELDEENFSVRLPSIDEINNIIDNGDYRKVDGLYMYYEYSNSKSGVPLSRDELFDILKKKYIFCFVTFKYKIIVEKEQILLIKINKKKRNLII